VGPIFERSIHVAFVSALQHALAPHPVEEHGPQVLGSFSGCVRGTGVRIAATTTTLCAGRSLRAARAATLCTLRILPHARWSLHGGCHRRADCDESCERETYRAGPSEIHGGSPLCVVSRMPVRTPEVKAYVFGIQ